MLSAKPADCVLEVPATMLLGQWLQPGYLRKCWTRNVVSTPKPLSSPWLCLQGLGRGTEVCPTLSAILAVADGS